MDNQGLWNDIEEMFFSPSSVAQKYRFFYDTLHRVCIGLTQSLPTEYGDFFSSLQAVCRLTNFPLHNVDTFRWRARQVSHHGMESDEQTFLQDVRAFVDAVAHFTNSAAPARMMQKLPQAVSHQPLTIKQIEHQQRKKRLRFTVIEVSEPYILARAKDIPSEEPLKISMATNAHTLQAAQLLKEGMQFNALSYTIDADGVYHPLYIIVEPDYLLDITSITGCLKSYGDSAFNHLIDKLKPQKTTVYTLIGDFANQFLDDAFNLENPEYRLSMQKVFAERIIDICACGEIDDAFFSTTHAQFQNILSTVAQLNEIPPINAGKYVLHLEPSFICEALGVQGRMDCLIDFAEEGKKFLIELKSGKWDEYRNRAKVEHLMQMLLYKEILYYNTDIRQSDVYGNLLYSRYPKLQEQRSFQDIVFNAMNIRNNIVCMERGLVQGEGRAWLPRLTPNALRRDPSCNDKFWNQWCLPEIVPITNAIASMDVLTADYFYTFLQFIEREQYESKVCDSRPDSTRSMSSLWNADINTKLENGDIYLDLSIIDIRVTDGVDAIFLSPKASKEVEVLPNFRIGDSVILYQRNTNEDSAITQQVVRCSVEDYVDDCVWLKLKFPQRNAEIFQKDKMYAIEHDHVEASFRSLYSSLFSLVTADKSKRELVLCQRDPAYNETLSLNHTYTNTQIDSIVLRAKQAQDMFLLMGPPGTGKTSVALKSMVEEFMSENENILLLSYTNRAVDEICEMLSSITPEIDYIRLGRPLSCATQHQAHLVCNTLGKLSNRKIVVERIKSTRIFVSTVASLNSHLNLLALKRFGVAIFDEASQILEPQIMSILTSPSIGKFIMIGDHKQLPAVVVQNEELSKVTSKLLNDIGLTNCRNSLFERLYEQYRNNEHVVAMLDHQGRMHPEISGFASRFFYDNCLLPVGLEHQVSPLPNLKHDVDNHFEHLVATSRCAFLDIPLPSIEDRQPKANVFEAKCIANIIRTIISLHFQNGISINPVKQIGVIVPFRRQIVLVRNEIEKAISILKDEIPSLLKNDSFFASNIAIDTVERYQGSQRDIIIYGTTITQNYELDNLSNLVNINNSPIDRKLNVAITRARKQLFILGNANLLSQNPIYKELIKYANSI